MHGSPSSYYDLLLDERYCWLLQMRNRFLTTTVSQHQSNANSFQARVMIQFQSRVYGAYQTADEWSQMT